MTLPKETPLGLHSKTSKRPESKKIILIYYMKLLGGYFFVNIQGILVDIAYSGSKVDSRMMEFPSKLTQPALSARA